jgi:hypothetical protein
MVFTYFHIKKFMDKNNKLILCYLEIGIRSR